MAPNSITNSNNIIKKRINKKLKQQLQHLDNIINNNINMIKINKLATTSTSTPTTTDTLN